MIQFKKKAMEPQLDINNADLILKNVFEANQVEPNSIPLDVLTAYSNYRKERFALQRSILVIVMLLFLLLPFLFVSPSITVSTTDERGMINPIYTVDVDTFIPIERITAMIDGHNISVYETDVHSYTVEPSANGRMEISVTLVNRQTVTHYIDVENVDKEPPLVVSHKVDKDNIYLYLSDTGSGVHYEEIKAFNLNGEELAPTSYDSSDGCVAFPYSSGSLNVYIPDYADNELHLILTMQ